MKKTIEKDYINAHRKSSRDEEFENHGKAVNLKHVQKTKKAYNRSKAKSYDGEDEDDEYDDYKIR